MEFAEIKEFLGIDDSIETIDQFKEKFNSSFLSREKAHLDDEVKGKAVGDVIRRLGSKVAQEFGDFGIKTTDFEKNPFEDVIKIAAANVKAKLQDGDHAKPEKKYLDLEAQFNTVKQERDQFRTQLETVGNDFETYKQTKDGEVKTWKIGTMFEKVKEKVAFKDMTDIERLGFETKVQNSLMLDLDGDSLIVKTKDGKFIPSKLKAGGFADPVEALTLIAEEANVLKKNGAVIPEKKIPAVENQSTKKFASTYEKRKAQFNS